MKEDAKSIEEYLRNIDPFDIPLERYRSLINNDEYRSLANRIITERLYELYGDWIENEFKKRKEIQSLLLCDKEVVLESKETYGPSSKYIVEIEEKIGKPSYLVGREALIEEKSMWSDLGNGDYYPTIEIYIGKIGWDDKDVFRRGIKIRSDFDTGNQVFIK